MISLANWNQSKKKKKKKKNVHFTVNVLALGLHILENAASQYNIFPSGF
jgi:hypothetical protein